MIRNKNIVKLFFTFCIASLGLISCESDPDQLGSQFFDKDAAQGFDASYDVIAFNKNNNDTIRTDAGVLKLAAPGVKEMLLGAFNEGHFGGQKATFFTQVRLSSYDPNFGTNPVLDSVVLEIKPTYHLDSLTTSEDKNFSYNGKEGTKTVKSYPIKKYGKTKLGGKTTFSIKVEEVVDFLGSADQAVYSNAVVNTSTFLGSKVFGGDITSINIKDNKDNTNLLDREAAIRINLDNTFFQNKIIAKQGSGDLKNAANFIRWFKGIKISVDEIDGYLFNFATNQAKLTMYYRSGDPAENKTFTFDLGSTNVQFNTFDFTRPAAYNTMVSGINTTTGDPKLYLQGTGGMGAQIRINQADLDQLKLKYQQDKIGVLSAKIRLYTDSNTWTGTYAKPRSFTVNQDGVNTFMEDMSFFPSYQYSLVSAYKLDENPAYYDIDITKTIKDIIESGKDNKDLIINVGDYIGSASSGSLVNLNHNSRSYVPNRIILVGSDPANTNRARLNIKYTKK